MIILGKKFPQRSEFNTNAADLILFLFSDLTHTVTTPLHLTENLFAATREPRAPENPPGLVTPALMTIFATAAVVASRVCPAEIVMGGPG